MKNIWGVYNQNKSPKVKRGLFTFTQVQGNMHNDVCLINPEPSTSLLSLCSYIHSRL